MPRESRTCRTENCVNMKRKVSWMLGTTSVERMQTNSDSHHNTFRNLFNNERQV